ncbi:hypothetical protein ABK040_012571 [Willaertia magna]
MKKTIAQGGFLRKILLFKKQTTTTTTTTTSSSLLLSTNHNGITNNNRNFQINKIKLQESNKEEDIFIAPSGGHHILSWGSNSEGQLGLNLPINKKKQLEAQFLDPYWFNNKKIKKIATHPSGTHCLALTQDGYLYAWGRGAEFQLGLENNDSVYAPTLVDPKFFKDVEILDIACGAYHSCILDSNFNLYTWGYGGSLINASPLGHGKNRKWLKEPKLVESIKGEKVKMIACGEYHMGVLCQDTNYQHVDNFTDTKIFMWGKGEYGRLGNGTTSKLSPSLLEVKELNENTNELESVNFMKLKCGKNYSSLLDRNGNLYMFGRNDSQQLGIETTIGYASSSQFDAETTPKKLKLKNIKDMALGDTITCCVTNDGDAYIWGKSVYLPHKVTFENRNIFITACFAGRNHVAFLSEDKFNVYMMGSNWYNQLGVEGQFGAKEVLKLTKEVIPGKKLQMALGNGFSMALVDLDASSLNE